MFLYFVIRYRAFSVGTNNSVRRTAITQRKIKKKLTKFYGYFFGFDILTNGMKFTIRAQKRNYVSRRQIHNRSLSRLYAVDRRRRMYKLSSTTRLLLLAGLFGGPC